jgi:hypothetical protein
MFLEGGSAVTGPVAPRGCAAGLVIGRVAAPTAGLDTIQSDQSSGTAMSVQPHAMPRVVPMLSYEDVARAADWVAEVFRLQ